MGTILFLVFVSDVIAKKYLGLGEPIVYDHMHYVVKVLGKIVVTYDLMETSLR